MGDIEFSDPQAIAMAARPHVTEEQLRVLREAVNDGRRWFSLANAETLETLGLFAVTGRTLIVPRLATGEATDAGRCLLAMVDGQERGGGV